jgi:hypothetical protein
LFGFTRFSFGLRPELDRRQSIFSGFNPSFGVLQFFRGVPCTLTRHELRLSGMIFMLLNTSAWHTRSRLSGRNLVPTVEQTRDVVVPAETIGLRVPFP